MTRDEGERFDSLLRAIAASPHVALPGSTVLAQRFLLQRRLGEGGFGVVYEAEDLRDGGRVALKLLRSAEASWLYRFKREFRSLQGLVHPNLVGLDELFGEHDRWFFTMELVAGRDFIGHVSEGLSSPALQEPCESTVRAIQPGLRAHRPAPAQTQVRRAAFHEPKLRDSLRQLCEGLFVLHAAGKVHRDIKPSNVLVTPAGRVVLIDFGLVTDASHSLDSATIGTPAYMAPEQAASRKVSPAADLYAVGVMLYELLTGRMPIQGGRLQVLMDKQTCTPLPPLSIVSGVPEDLNALCMKLLHVDPEQRPSTAEVCRSLAAVQAVSVATSARPAEPAIFVGRSAELCELRVAFETSLQGRLTTLLVRGESGIGKTYLVRQFLDQLSTEHPRAMLLEGRCYEREAIPYKALDGIVDALSRRLSRMPASEVAALLPARRTMLTRIFPALLRIPELVKEHAKVTTPAGLDGELRQQAFLELRELFARVARHCPTVIFIDDLQWADDDGLRALAEILRAPDAPPLLFIGALRRSRGGSTATSDRLQALLPGDMRLIEVAGLGSQDARELATALLARPDAAQVDPQAIALEAGGHPLFVEELARHATLGPRPEEVSLDDVIWSRVLLLETAARELTELVAVAGKPLSQKIAAAATQLVPTEFQRRVAVLRASNLVRTSGAGWADSVEPYHDRVREAVLTRLERPRRQILHRRLALAFEASSGSRADSHASTQLDSETLATHWLEAGDLSRAGGYAMVAGDQAGRAFAFDRAAAWFEQSLALLPDGGASRRTLRIKLGNALAFAGRGALAAEHFEAAADESQAADALELRRRAAEQLLVSGHFDRGIAASRLVLAAIGMRIPATRFGTLASLVYYGLLLRLRGLRFRARPQEQISVEEKTRIDTCFSMAAALGFVETVVGFVFQRRALLLALASGDLERIGRSMAMDAAYTALVGRRSWPRTQRLLRNTQELAERSNSTMVRIFAAGNTGIALYLNGRFGEAAQHLMQTFEMLTDGSTGLVHERVTARMFLIQALAFQGRFKELRRLQRDGLRETLAQQNVYAAVTLRIGYGNLAWLIDDEPASAEREIDEAMQQWSKSGFHLEHFYALAARARISGYVGELGQGHALASELLRLTERSLLWRTQILRLRALYIRGGSALGMLEQKLGDRALLLREVGRDARAIERERSPWMQPFAKVLRAGIALHEGFRDKALHTLDAAAQEYGAHGMAAYRAAVRDRAARLRDDASSAAEIASALELLKAEEVRAPERLICMLVPGLMPSPATRSQVTPARMLSRM